MALSYYTEKKSDGWQPMRKSMSFDLFLGSAATSNPEPAGWMQRVLPSWSQVPPASPPTVFSEPADSEAACAAAKEAAKGIGKQSLHPQSTGLRASFDFVPSMGRSSLHRLDAPRLTDRRAAAWAQQRSLCALSEPSARQAHDGGDMGSPSSSSTRASTSAGTPQGLQQIADLQALKGCLLELPTGTSRCSSSACHLAVKKAKAQPSRGQVSREGSGSSPRSFVTKSGPSTPRSQYLYMTKVQARGVSRWMQTSSDQNLYATASDLDSVLRRSEALLQAMTATVAEGEAADWRSRAEGKEDFSGFAPGRRTFSPKPSSPRRLRWASISGEPCGGFC